MNTYPNAEKNAYAVTTKWDQNTITWDIGAPWNNSGGDFNLLPEANNTNTDINVWEDYDVTNSIKVIHNNEKQNYGFILKLSEEGKDNGVTYASSEYIQNLKLRPKLTIILDLSSNIETICNSYNNKTFKIIKKDQNFWFHLNEKKKTLLQGYDLQGRLVFTMKEENKTTIKIPLKDPGCYLLKIVINEKINNIKIIKH